MRKGIKFALSTTAIAALLVSAGCGGSGSQPTNAEKGSTSSTGKKIVNIALKEDPPNLDPAKSSALVDRMVQNSIYDKLFDLDKDGKIVPMLAESYEVSKDGLTYTIKLKKGVKFQDGTDFNADAVKFNIERDKAETTSKRKAELAFVDKVTVVDPNTVQLQLSKPFSPLISIFTDRSGMMVSPEAVKKYGDDFLNHPVGTGPYTFIEHVKGDHIALKKNENYWNGKVKVDELNYKIFTNATAAVQNLKSGQLDIIDTIPTKDITALKSDANVSLVTEPGMGYQGVYLNTTKEPLNNKFLREAINKAIDRESLVKVVYDGYAKPANSPFAPGNLAYGDTDKIVKPNPDEIKDLLAKGGKPGGFSFKLQITQAPADEQVGTVIQNMLKPYNINVELEKLEFGTLLDNGVKNNFQAFLLSWSGRPDPDQNFYDFVVTDTAQNYARISNPKLDELAKQARTELDAAKRKEIYDKAMETVQDESGYAYLFHMNNNFGFSKKITGFTYVPDGIIRTATLDKQ